MVVSGWNWHVESAIKYKINITPGDIPWGFIFYIQSFKNGLRKNSDSFRPIKIWLYGKWILSSMTILNCVLFPVESTHSGLLHT